MGSRLERTLYWYGEAGYEPSELRRLLGDLLDEQRYLAFEMAQRPGLLSRTDLDGTDRASRDVLVVPAERVDELV